MILSVQDLQPSPSPAKFGISVLGRIAGALEILVNKMNTCTEMSNDKGKMLILALANYMMSLDSQHSDL